MGRSQPKLNNKSGIYWLLSSFLFNENPSPNEATVAIMQSRIPIMLFSAIAIPIPIIHAAVIIANNKNTHLICFIRFSPL